MQLLLNRVRQEVSLQKSYLNPSWMILASPAVLIRPKFGDVSELAAELAAVDALARLSLVARRLGCPLKVRRASPELRDLVELCGLTDALGVVRRNGRQPEQREQPVDVEERVDPDDPPV